MFFDLFICWDVNHLTRVCSVLLWKLPRLFWWRSCFWLPAYINLLLAAWRCFQFFILTFLFYLILHLIYIQAVFLYFFFMFLCSSVHFLHSCKVLSLCLLCWLFISRMAYKYLLVHRCSRWAVCLSKWLFLCFSAEHVGLPVDV